MDLQHAGLFVLVWISVGLFAIYLIAVYNANKQRKIEDKEKYDKSPIGIFWRNLKQLITKIIIYAISKVAYL